MRKAITLFVSILACAYSSHGQADVKVVQRFRRFIHLVELNNARELSKYVSYPLVRTYPLPDIKNATEFINYYPVLFDDTFRQLLIQHKSSGIWEHNGSYTIKGLSGEIWLNEDGKIQAINYSSPQEQHQRQVLIDQLKKQMHTSVREWDENIIYARSEKLLVRVDRLAKGDLRYACWSKGKTMKEEPDIVLFHGEEEAQGTMGGWTWTFTNNRWTYIVNEADMCDDPKNCGLFLELQHDGQMQSRVRLKEIK